MNGKPELTKTDVGGGVTTMGALVQRRAEIGARLDQVIDEFGQLYEELVKVQSEIWRRLYSRGVHGVAAPYYWLEGITTVERLRSRLGAACEKYSSGPGTEAPFGPVHCRLPLQEVFEKDHVGVVERADSPNPQTETTEAYYKRTRGKG